MSSMCRILSKSISSCVYQCSTSLLNSSRKSMLFPLAAYSSDKCGSDKKGSDSGSKGSDPCDPCSPWCCSPCPPCDNDPSCPNLYDTRKYGHCLPSNNVNVYFEPLHGLPTGIFRNTDGEVLGLGAGKCCYYKNPEYFCYHHMSYYDMHMLLRAFRKTSPKTNRKP